MNWPEFITRFAAYRRERKAAREAAQRLGHRLDDAIEHVVEEVNPAIRAITGYRRKLRAPVATAMDFAADLVQQIPEMVVIDERSWAADPRVRAFFSGTGDLRRVYSRSHAVQEFFRHPDRSHCFAMLSMEKQERQVLGSEMRGEVARRDVKRIAVSFTDRRVVYPSLSESELRQNLQERVIELLLTHVLEQISGLIDSQNHLEQQRSLIEMRLRMDQVKAAGLSSAFEKGIDPSTNVDSLRERHRHAGKELEQLRARLTTLDDYLERIAEVFGAPERYLRLDTLHLCLDQMNLKVERPAASGQQLVLTQASLADKLKRILVLTRFPRDLLLPAEQFRREAERALY